MIRYYYWGIREAGVEAEQGLRSPRQQLGKKKYISIPQARDFEKNQ